MLAYLACLPVETRRAFMSSGKARRGFLSSSLNVGSPFSLESAFFR